LRVSYPLKIGTHVLTMPEKKRKTHLIWIGFFIALLSFVSKEVSESLEKTKQAMETEIGSYRTYLGQSTTQMQILESRQQLELMLRENSSRNKKEPDDQRDFTTTIARDTSAVREAMADTQVNLEDVSRLIDTLPMFSQGAREQLDGLTRKVQESNKQIESSLTPSPRHDWSRAVEVKIDVIMPLLDDASVSLLGDAVQKQAEAQIKILSFLQTVTKLCWRVLIVLGLLLVLYGYLTGQKTFGAGE
jgi:hypothetical protein